MKVLVHYADGSSQTMFVGSRMGAECLVDVENEELDEDVRVVAVEVVPAGYVDPEYRRGGR
jgi:hypothetical protein